MSHPETRTPFETPQPIAISGASGLIGGALAEALGRDGRPIAALVRPGRSAPGLAEIAWDPSGGTVDRGALEGAEAIVHLAGESIAAGRWTDARKRQIRQSRVEGTRSLAQAILAMERPPKVLIAASAVGYYGDRGAETLREDSASGDGFLAEVCREWERAAAPAAERTRVVILRFGVVLSIRGGVLSRLLPLFRAGLGGPVGSGEQYLSWIAIDDLIEVIIRAVEDPSMEGPFNCTAPEPVTNRQFTRAVGHALGRPAILPAPSFALRLVLGEMADELLLASTRAVPTKLEALGFGFRSKVIGEALSRELARARK